MIKYRRITLQRLIIAKAARTIPCVPTAICFYRYMITLAAGPDIIINAFQMFFGLLAVIQMLIILILVKPRHARTIPWALSGRSATPPFIDQSRATKYGRKRSNKPPRKPVNEAVHPVDASGHKTTVLIAWVITGEIINNRIDTSANATGIGVSFEIRNNDIVDNTFHRAVFGSPITGSDFDAHFPIISGNQHQDAIIFCGIADPPMVKKARGERLNRAVMII
nr:hypothetical protein [Halocynthiibacter namhaensis]